MTNTSYNIAIIGDGGVGKTTFLSQVKQCGFLTKYVATVGSEAHPYACDTNKGVINMTLWDYAGQAKFAGDRSRIKNADSVIIMYDVSRRSTFEHISSEWMPLTGTAPVLLVANKCDIEERLVPEYETMEISCKIDPDSVLNVIESALQLASGDPTLEISKYR